MICSEFAAKTILAGLLEQERQLKEQMVDYLVEQKEMKRGEAKKFVEKVEVFSLPITGKRKIIENQPTPSAGIISTK